jgi:lysophospholipid acyltransferase (LPLAT)-like uncharacterized protein
MYKTKMTQIFLSEVLKIAQMTLHYKNSTMAILLNTNKGTYEQMKSGRYVPLPQKEQEIYKTINYEIGRVINEKSKRISKRSSPKCG